MTTEIDYASSTLSFPQKLYALMERESGDCVIWERGGLCFRITDQATFSKEIVPRYFKQTKMTSFQRQLNLYGFRRITAGPDAGCYFHPSFRRSRRDLLEDMRRMQAKDSLLSFDQVLLTAGQGLIECPDVSAIASGMLTSKRSMLPSCLTIATSAHAVTPPLQGAAVMINPSFKTAISHSNFRASFAPAAPSWYVTSSHCHTPTTVAHTLLEDDLLDLFSPFLDYDVGARWPVGGEYVPTFDEAIHQYQLRCNA